MLKCIVLIKCFNILLLWTLTINSCYKWFCSIEILEFLRHELLRYSYVRDNKHVLNEIIDQTYNSFKNIYFVFAQKCIVGVNWIRIYLVINIICFNRNYIEILDLLCIFYLFYWHKPHGWTIEFFIHNERRVIENNFQMMKIRKNDRVLDTNDIA